MIKMGRPRKIKEEVQISEEVKNDVNITEDSENVKKEEPKKRGRKKKEVNDLVESIQDLHLEEFQIHSEKDVNLAINSEMNVATNSEMNVATNPETNLQIEMEKTREAIQNLKIDEVESLFDDFEDMDRNQRRESKSLRIRENITSSSNEEIEYPILYLYLYGRELTVWEEEKDDDKTKYEKKSYVYQLFILGKYENTIYVEENERKDIEYEDEIEWIESKWRIHIRIMKEKPFSTEYQMDRWKDFNFMYRKTSGKMQMYEIMEAIQKKETWYIKDEYTKNSIRMVIDNSRILESNIYYLQSGYLKDTGMKIKDLIKKIEMEKKMKSEKI